jgi:hypothetical protein
VEAATPSQTVEAASTLELPGALEVGSKNPAEPSTLVEVSAIPMRSYIPLKLLSIN